ncbi:hypothetical protein C5167_026294 [Papaver somniferum]|nr:hypothetical protein C5167_026294 [Papaver somniferum]
MFVRCGQRYLKHGKGKKKALHVNKDRFIGKMFLLGDSVIIVLRNPKQSLILESIKLTQTLENQVDTFAEKAMHELKKQYVV